MHTRDGLAHRSPEELQQIVRKRRIEGEQPVDEAGAMGDTKCMGPAARTVFAVSIVLELWYDVVCSLTRRHQFAKSKALLRNPVTRAELQFNFSSTEASRVNKLMGEDRTATSWGRRSTHTSQ
jgi:hypothetical protein